MGGPKQHLSKCKAGFPGKDSPREESSNSTENKTEIIHFFVIDGYFSFRIKQTLRYLLLATQLIILLLLEINEPATKEEYQAASVYYI